MCDCNVPCMPRVQVQWQILWFSDSSRPRGMLRNALHAVAVLTQVKTWNLAFCQVLEAMALAEPPPDYEDKLQPDIEGMQKVAGHEIDAFRVCPSPGCGSAPPHKQYQEKSTGLMPR